MARLCGIFVQGRPCATAKLRFVVHADHQPSFGQCLNNAFSDLLGFLRIEFFLRTFFEAFANRGRNYRNHLMLINQLLTLRAALIVLHVTLGHISTAIIRSAKMNWPGRLRSGRSIQYLNSGIALS